MTMHDDHTDSAVALFRSLVADGLTPMSRFVDVLGSALVVGIADLRRPDGLVDPIAARTSFPWLTVPDQPFPPERAKEIVDSLDARELRDRVSRAFDDYECLAWWDPSAWSASLTGTHWSDSFSIDDAFFSVDWCPEPGGRMTAISCPDYDREDRDGPMGRRETLRCVVDNSDISYAWGRRDAWITADLPVDLLERLRAAAEEHGGGPWESNRLAALTASWDETNIAALTPLLAARSGVPPDDARAILEDLRRHPNTTPATPRHHDAAWWLIETSSP